MVWTFTPSGQRFHDDWHQYTASGGWWHSVALRGLLLGHWLPAAAPVAPDTAAGSAPGGSVASGGGGPGGPGGRVWIGIAALALLLLLAAVAGRPRRVASGIRR